MTVVCSEMSTLVTCTYKIHRLFERFVKVWLLVLGEIIQGLSDWLDKSKPQTEYVAYRTSCISTAWHHFGSHIFFKGRISNPEVHSCHPYDSYDCGMPSPYAALWLLLTQGSGSIFDVSRSQRHSLCTISICGSFQVTFGLHQDRLKTSLNLGTFDFFASETAVTLAFIIVSISLVIPMDTEFLIVQEMFLLINVPVLCSWIASPCSKRRRSVNQILTSPWITDSQKETNHRSCRPSTVIYFSLAPCLTPLEDLQILML